MIPWVLFNSLTFYELEEAEFDYKSDYYIWRMFSVWM